MWPILYRFSKATNLINFFPIFISTNIEHYLININLISSRLVNQTIKDRENHSLLFTE